MREARLRPPARDMRVVELHMIAPAVPVAATDTNDMDMDTHHVDESHKGDAALLLKAMEGHRKAMEMQFPDVIITRQRREEVLCCNCARTYSVYE